MKRPEKRAREREPEKESQRKRAREQGARQKEKLRPDRRRATQMSKENGYCKQTVRGMSVVEVE